MQQLPRGSQVVRTWFGGDDAWERLKQAIATPSEEGFLADVGTVDDRAYENLDSDQLPALTPSGDYGATVSFIADERTLSSADLPLLVVRVLPAQPGEPLEHTPFRVTAAELWSVENNLNLSNMDWDDFAGAADPDGVFRGF